MLEFNHLYRISAKELLKHQVFDDIRVQRLEQGAPYKIHLLCDAKDAYDYSEEKDNFCESIKDYELLIMAEVQQLWKYNFIL